MKNKEYLLECIKELEAEIIDRFNLEEWELDNDFLHIKEIINNIF